MLPGEIMKVFILKEGKEYNQGVAYLDDGTMVVVDNARRMISKNIDIVRHERAADHGGEDDLRPLYGGCRYGDAFRRPRRPRPRPPRRTPAPVVPGGAPSAECQVAHAAVHWWRTVLAT